jgi:hypothetical protein
MNTRSLIALALAALFHATMVAQDNCPKEQAQRIDASSQYGISNTCAGIHYQIGDVQITTPSTGCPSHVLYTPAHSIAVPSRGRTQVRAVAQDPVTLVTFHCVRDWLLFIPIGSQCVVKSTQSVGTVLQLVTEPCLGQTRA